MLYIPSFYASKSVHLKFFIYHFSPLNLTTFPPPPLITSPLQPPAPPPHSPFHNNFPFHTTTFPSTTPDSLSTTNHHFSNRWLPPLTSASYLHRWPEPVTPTYPHRWLPPVIPTSDPQQWPPPVTLFIWGSIDEIF